MFFSSLAIATIFNYQFSIFHLLRSNRGCNRPYQGAQNPEGEGLTFPLENFVPQELDGLLDIRVHQFIIEDERHLLTILIIDLLKDWGCLQRQTEVEGLGCIEQLDSQHPLGVQHHLI